MKNKLFTISLFVFTAVVVGFYPFFQKAADATVKNGISLKPKIQLAILLDTSSSMSGLLNQTRNQIWQIVNDFSKAEQNGIKPSLEVAVYEYGNSQLHENKGFIRQVSALTGELDQVSEALFSLTTSGGSEYCGYVINTAVNELNWSHSDGDIKAIFIAGNEPFTQGPISYKNAISFAKNKGIIVNTIHAGNVQQGANSGWKDGALLAGGEYMGIDHNYKVSHITAPQDKKIAKLNKQLNETYIPYGKRGKEKLKRQQAQDERASTVSSALMSKRSEAKASRLYDNSSWDLADALDTGRVDLDSIDESELSEELQKMAKPKRKEFVNKKLNNETKLNRKF